ncbi:MAG TPA: amino acid adenylation domain-containing protein, partial [Candidatus Deferrimicrobium sp.]|nr:amino acid adenylation domain-containing protein [Candidatus Deferrimicrobium sp.]
DIELTDTELRAYLLKDLPEYMIPAYFIRLKEIPLTANGKINRRALPDPVFITAKEIAEPGNDIEKKLAAIWNDILPSIPDGRLGIDDNFFQAGGHSLKATILASRIHKEFNVKIPLMEIFKTPTIRELAGYIEGMAHDLHVAIEPAEEKEYHVLSSAQKRMYFLQQFDVTAVGYNMPLILPLGKGIDKNKLESILRQLIERHESLRTSFERINEEVVQKIHKIEDIDFSLDYYKAEKTNVKETIKNYIKPFDLSRAPLLRSALIESPGGNYTWAVDMHHIISDGTSHTILIEDFMAAYLGKKLKPLPIQYKDFAAWQERQFESGVIKTQMDYWLGLYGDEIPRLNLPADYQRPEIFTFAGDTYEFIISGPEAKKFKELGSQAGGTLYMNMLAVLNVLFYKYTGQTDIIIGSGVAGRRHADLQGIVGMFINTLVMRNYPEADKYYQSFLKEVITGCVRGFENQDVQFEDLVDNLNLERDASRNPVFDIMIMAQNFRSVGEGNSDAKAEYGNMSLENLLPAADENAMADEYKNFISKFDMTFFVNEQGDDLAIDIEYYTAVFTLETIQRMASHLKNIITSIANSSFIKIKDIEMISDDEKQKVIYEFNDTIRDYPQDQTIHHLFAEQAGKTPDRIAIFGHGLASPTWTNTGTKSGNAMVITYRELHEQSNRLAYSLIEKGVQADHIVGIMMERSIEQIIGILGILKSGGAYLPIDPEYPQERIDYMLKDSAAKILLTAAYVFNSHHSSFTVHHSIPSNLAYIIYTSGTTGRPKGVMVEHGNIFNTIYWRKQEYNFTGEDRALQLFSFAFDGFLISFFTPVVSGSAVVQLNEEETKDIVRIKEIIAAIGITYFICVPAFFRSLLEITKSDDLSSLKIVSLGGEQVQPDLVEKCKQLNPLLRVANDYGPTESSVQETIYRDIDPNRIIPIGKPIANTKIHIIDKDENLLPPGIAGQLTISGKGLARGYLNKPGLTAEKFINFHHAKLYCTGDLGRWLPDGNIEFLGRMDHQVKIRGFRIELGEIENRLLGHPGITGGVVTLGTRKSGEKYICAYFTAATPLEISVIRDYLSGHLPGYMIPAYLMQIENIPITPSGKIDKKRLPAPESKTDDRFVAPKSNCEKAIASLWKEVLELE